jgi:hypothetical protein
MTRKDLRRVASGLWNTEQSPGFLKHLIVGVVSSGLTIGTALWTASGAWTERGERLRVVEQKVDTHLRDSTVHLSIDGARSLEARLAKLEAQQVAIREGVGEIRQDVRAMLEDLRRLTR